MLRGTKSWRALAVTLAMLSAGCAVLPIKSTSDLETPVSQRDILAEAAYAVERAPWPKPQKVSLMARMTGGGQTLARTAAIDAYLTDLNHRGVRFATLEMDARANLRAAHVLNMAALDALDAPMLSMDDVVLVEGAISSLREHRDIFVITAKEIAKSGETIDNDTLNALRLEFRDAMRSLGGTADRLADRIANDRRSTYAAPDSNHDVNNFSDL